MQKLSLFYIFSRVLFVRQKQLVWNSQNMFCKLDNCNEEYKNTNKLSCIKCNI